MLKKLPIYFGFIVFFLSFFNSPAFAQQPSAVPASDTGNVNIHIAEDDPSSPSIGTTPVDGEWVSDPTVTFVGKTASRSGDFLDWTIRNYDWSCVKTSTGACSDNGNPLAGYWALIRNIVYALLIAVVMIAAFVMIITRGRSLTITRFIPRFILIIVLVTLSYAIIQFIYQVIDIVQGFFLRPGGQIISTRDLIFIGFDYKSFEGFRKYGSQYDESAFVTLLLVRLTALTYYVMTGILLIRKIILWFFLILSPVFPLLLFFRPIRNTGKIWIGEFFRWLLYAPLFAIFLQGLVVLWRSKTGIPLAFDFTSSGHLPVEANIVYPTAVNILIGGPGQKIGIFNSVNLQDTFALYVVALLMLWVVIILPFLLLKIFLDYLGGISFQENTTVRRLLDRGSSFLPIGKPPSPAPVSPLPPPLGAGRAMQIPMGSARSISEGKANTFNKTVNETRNIQNYTNTPVNAHILQLANLSVPKMRDIAKYETSMVSHNQSRMQDIARLKTSLNRISNPSSITSSSERERYMQVKEQLISEKQKGNVLASSILSAANTTNNTTNIYNTAPSNTNQSNTENNYTGGVNTTVSSGSKSATLREMEKKGVLQAENLKRAQDVHLPQTNKVQEVSIEDYEEVRKMWLDTYQSAAPPGDPTGKVESREEWIKGDIDKINQAISLLNSVDPVRNREGMDMVSNILPFLMIGGFSRTEVIAYLKAKLEAAKTAVSADTNKKEDEDTLLDREKKTTTASKHMTTTAEAELPSEENGEKKLEELRKQGQ